MDDVGELHLFGVSFRTASEQVREGLAFSPSQVRDLLAGARAALPGTEAVVLSTCNRTEVYLAGPDGARLAAQWHALLRRTRPEAPALDVDVARYELSGADAYRHLLRVLCGLDSALLGDGQVMGQVRQALELAQQAGTLGGVLSPAFASALKAGKRARSTTDIGKGSPGVGTAVAGALTQRQVDPAAQVLVLGTGQAARAVLGALAKSGYRQLAVSGRTAASTAEVAARHAADAVAWSQRAAAMRQADVVVVATAAAGPVLTRLDSERTRLVVDAGFPRQVTGTVASAERELVSLLALTESADAAAAARRAAIPAVEELIAGAVAEWVLARDRAPLEHAIKQLHLAAAEAARQAALAVAAETGVAPQLVEQHLVRQVRRALHPHVEALRALPAARP